MSNEMDGFQFLGILLCFAFIYGFTTLGVLYLSDKLTKNMFYAFLVILATGVVSSLVPMGPISMIFGFPAVFINAILTTLFFRKRLGPIKGE